MRSERELQILLVAESFAGGVTTLNVVQTDGLTKIYGPPSGLRRLLMRAPTSEPVVALDDVSFAAGEGEVLGLLGPNGAGKTTLVKILATLVRPTRGRASVCGYDVVRHEDEVRRLVGLVAGDERSFYWRLSGRQNLEFFAALCGVRRSAAKSAVEEVLGTVALTDQADDMFYTYSTGMRQRLAIARALLGDARVLFFDEPTKSLDAVAAAELRRLIRRQLAHRQRRTVILATHQLDEAEKLCDRVAILHEGWLMYCGGVARLRELVGGQTRYAILVWGVSELTAAAVGAGRGLADIAVEADRESGLLRLTFSCSENGKSPLSSVLRDLLDKGGSIVSCEKGHQRLEDMFLAVLGKGAGRG